MPDPTDPTPPTPNTPDPHKVYDFSLLDTPKQIELFRLLQMKYALKIEIETGLRHSRGSIKKLVEQTLIRNGWLNEGDSFRTKAAAFEALDTYIEMNKSQL